MNRREAGFTLLEVLVALAIAVMLGTLLLRTSVSALHWMQLQSQRVREHAQTGELVDRLESEEDAAWAIFTPATDVNGRANADGHEVDFFTRDGQSRPYFWAYTYDPNAQTLTRSSYSAVGGAPVTDVVYTGITGFYAQTYPVSALRDPSSKIYSPLYASAALVTGSVAFFSGTPVAGGNQITYVRITGPTLVRDLELSTQTAPSGFVVVLQYTPPPTPTPPSATPTPGPLVSWPQFIELPMNGEALQSAWVRPPHDVAYYVNGFLGGGIADAALAPCGIDQGRAFTGATFSAVLADATAPAGVLPSGVSASTDSSGCITFSSSAFTNGMPNVALSETGFTGAFSQQSTTCGAAVSVAHQYPANGQGPQVQLVSIAGSAPTPSCAIAWQGATMSNRTSTIYEVSGCIKNGSSTYQLIGIRQTCNGAVIVPAQYSGDCGEKPLPATIISGPGTVTGTADNFTVTRIGTGTITVSGTFDEKWQTGTKGACTAKTYIGQAIFSD